MLSSAEGVDFVEMLCANYDGSIGTFIPAAGAIEVEVTKSPVNIHSVPCAVHPNESDIHVESCGSNMCVTTDGARSDFCTGDGHNNFSPGHGGHRSLKDIK